MPTEGGSIIPAPVAPESSPRIREASSPRLDTLSSQNPYPERSPSSEKTRPSGKLMWHIAQGNFEDGNFDPAKTTATISERSFKALEAKHDNTRQTDSGLRRSDVLEFIKANKIPDTEITPELLHYAEMVLWSEKEAARMEMFLKTPSNKSATVQTLQKLGFDITVDSHAKEALADALFSENENGKYSYGKFYERFCRKDVDTNKALAATLDAAEMDSIKPFLVDILGSETAFNALKALRQTQEMLASTQGDTPKQSDAYKAESSLRENEQETFDYFKKGVAMLPPEPPAQPVPDPTQPPTTPEAPTAGKEKAPLLSFKGGSDTKESPQHPGRNEDTSFFDEVHGRAGIFDGASGHYRGDLASQEAQKAVQEVLAALSPTASLEEVQQKIRLAMEQANSRVNAISYPQGERHPVTTGTIYQVWQGSNGETKLVFASVGDSRLWIRKADGTTTYVTRDDNILKEKLKQGTIITEQQYKNIQQQIDGANTQEEVDKLGADWNQSQVTAMLGAKNLTYDTGIIDLQPGDIIFLTTDGVHDNLTKKEIEEIVRTNPDPQQLAEALVTKAKETSGKNRDEFPRAKLDDITAAALSLESSISPSPQSAEQRPEVKQTLAFIENVEIASTPVHRRATEESHLSQPISVRKDDIPVFVELFSRVDGYLKQAPYFKDIQAAINQIPQAEQANLPKAVVAGDESMTKPLIETKDGKIKVTLPSYMYKAWELDYRVTTLAKQLSEGDTTTLNTLNKTIVDSLGFYRTAALEKIAPIQFQIPKVKEQPVQVTNEQLQTLMKRFDQPGITRIFPEIKPTTQEIRQIATFIGEIKVLMERDSELKNLITMVNSKRADPAFQIALFFGAAVKENASLTNPRFVQDEKGTRIEVPPQLRQAWGSYIELDAVNDMVVALTTKPHNRSNPMYGQLGSRYAKALAELIKYKQAKGPS